MPSRLTSAARGPAALAVLAVCVATIAAGCVAASAQPSAAAAAPGGNAAPAVGAPAVVPGVPTTVGGTRDSGSGATGAQAGVAGSGTVGSGTANAAAIYPYPGYAGTGLAPDHTIVVTGSGQAAVKVDRSDRAAAQRSAIASALADAKAQATVVASDTGVTLGGVLSVGVSSSETYAVPMMGSSSVPPTVPQTGVGTTGPMPVPVEPTTTQFVVSVTVEYSIS